MTELEADDFLVKRVRQLRFVALAMLGGQFLLGVILVAVHFTKLNGKPLAPDLPHFGGIPVLTFVASFVAVSAIVVSFILPNIQRRQAVANLALCSPAPSPEDGPALLAGWQTGNIVRMFVFEMPTILSIIVFLFTGDYTCLAIAGILLALQAAGLPSETSARSWLAQAEDELARARSGSA